MPQTYSSQFNAILDTQAPTLLSELELTSFCVSNGTFDRFLQYPRKLILLNDMIFNSEIWRCNVKTVKNNLWILSHVYKAVPTYTASIMAYNAIRALVVVGDLWACKLVIGWLTQYQIGATGILFAGIALFYGLYVLLDYLGNQLNILLMNRYSSIRSIDLSKYMRGLLYHKLEEVELSCYEEKDFYDDLGRVLSEIDTRPVQVVNSFATGLYNLLTLVLITVIIFDPVFIAAALLYVVKHFWHIRKVNRINYEMDRDTQTSMRKVWYIKDLFKNREFIKEARNLPVRGFFHSFRGKRGQRGLRNLNRIQPERRPHFFFDDLNWESGQSAGGGIPVLADARRQIYAGGFCVSDQFVFGFYNQSKRAGSDRLRDADAQHVYRKHHKNTGLRVATNQTGKRLREK